MKKVITVFLVITSPIWVLPVCVAILFFFIYEELYDMLWGKDAR
jgi:uncharacterized membrane protein